jgi:aryl-alcohol dehydrogenase-like predicted oxidoreductase
MEYRYLGNTDTKVSVICLGTMTYGEQNSMQEAHAQLDYAFERDVNFIDTAEMYPVPPKEETYSLTEAIIGKWSKIKTHRDRIVLATKVAGPGRSMSYIRDGNPKLDKKNILAAADASLKRLNTDYIDLFQLHWPDRHTNFFGKLGYVYDPDEDATPILETLETLDTLQKSGKIRHIGVSNETPWGVMQFLKLAETNHLPKIVSIQNPYSLLNRMYEIGLAEISHRENIGLLAYSPLGFGVLTGKYNNGSHPEHSRLTLFKRFQRYTNPKAKQATEKYCEIAEHYGLTPTQLALGFVHYQPFVTSTIIGATTMEQLEENIDSIIMKLKREILDKIESVHQEFTNPCP